MITITSNPDLYLLSGNPIVISGTTNNHLSTSGTKSVLGLDFNTTPAVATTLRIQNTLIDLTFTVRLAHDGSGLSILYSLNTTTFRNNIMAALAGHPLFAKYYRVFAGPASDRFYIEALENGPIFNLTHSSSGHSYTIYTSTAGVLPVARPNFRIHLQILQFPTPSVTTNNSAIVIAERFAFVDSSGAFSEDIQELIHDQLNFEIEFPQGSAAQVCTQNAKRFVIKLSEYYGDTPMYYNPILSSIFWAFYGFRTKEQLISESSWYTQVLAENKNFLDDASSPRIVVPSQLELLYYVTNAVPGTFYVKAILNFDDGTSQTVNITNFTSTADQMVWAVPAGFERCGLQIYETVSKKVKNYWIQIFLGDPGGILMASRNYKIDRKYYRRGKELILGNNKGGYSTIFLKGKQTTIGELDGETFSSTLPNALSYTDFELIRTKPERKNKNVAQTGSITRVEKRWILDMLVTERAFERTGNNIFPIRIENKSLPYSDSDETYYEVTIEYSNSYVN